jgi:hypothetical protein
MVKSDCFEGARLFSYAAKSCKNNVSLNRL